MEVSHAVVSIVDSLTGIEHPLTILGATALAVDEQGHLWVDNVEFVFPPPNS